MRWLPGCRVATLSSSIRRIHVSTQPAARDPPPPYPQGKDHATAQAARRCEDRWRPVAPDRQTAQAVDSLARPAAGEVSLRHLLNFCRGDASAWTLR